jgi:hypothetical protein
MSGVSIADFNTAFENGYMVTPDPNLVQEFQGRPAIVVNISGVIDTDQNQHPGLLTEDPANDPTRRAVILGSYARKPHVN